MDKKISMLKFNIRERYSNLGDTAKKNFKANALSFFGITESQLYRRMVSDNLSADEIIYYSCVFGCEPLQLYNRPPELMQSAQAVRSAYAS
jgi:hypothetical protein